MKTTSIVLVALTLVSGFAEATNSSAKRKVQRNNRIEPEALNISYLSESNKALLNIILPYVNAPENEVVPVPEEDLSQFEEELGSVSEFEEVVASPGMKRKVVTRNNQRKSKAESAADALLCLSRSNASSIDIDCQSDESIEPIRKTRKSKSNANGKGKGKGRKKAVRGNESVGNLVEMSEKVFSDAETKNFKRYFDERNMQTAGSEFLFKCFHFSHFFNLAKYLIENGARFSETDMSVLDASFTSASLGGENEEISVAILMELLKCDPTETVNLFVKIAGTRDQEGARNLDAFLISLLMESETAFIFFDSPRIVDIIKLLTDTGAMPEALLFICNEFNGTVKEDVSIPIVVKAIRNGNAALVEIFLEKKWISVNSRFVLAENKSSLSLICNLFGHLSSETILHLISKFKYPLDYSHDSSINPEGDILLAAVMGGDLVSFKNLLLAGASYNIHLDGSKTLEFIITKYSSQFPGFKEALEEHKIIQAAGSDVEDDSTQLE